MGGSGRLNPAKRPQCRRQARACMPTGSQSWLPPERTRMSSLWERFRSYAITAVSSSGHSPPTICLEHIRAKKNARRMNCSCKQRPAMQSAEKILHLHYVSDKRSLRHHLRQILFFNHIIFMVLHLTRRQRLKSGVPLTHQVPIGWRKHKTVCKS